MEVLIADIDVRAKPDGTFVVTLDGLDVHLTSTYQVDLYDQILAHVQQGSVIPRAYSDDIIVAGANNLDQTVLAFIDECYDLAILGRPLPISQVQFAELIDWRRSTRKHDINPAMSDEAVLPMWATPIAFAYFAGMQLPPSDLMHFSQPLNN